MQLRLIALALACLCGVAAADDKPGLHVSTDVVTWDQPLTEAQCLDKAKAAITASVAGLTTVTATHAWVGTKTDWVISVDCLQSYQLNGAYVTVILTGKVTNDYTKAKAAVSRALGGKSEIFK